MNNQLATVQGTTAIDRGVSPEVVEATSRVRRIQEVMKGLMKDGTHYGQIPGTQKPTLYQPGAELLCATFRIAPTPTVENCSTDDTIRYRAIVRGVNQVTGEVLGEGVGECSSDEEKYRWRRPVCDQEWTEAPEELRREKWVTGRNGTYKQKQVRTSPADLANTILKMAFKRALVSMTRVVLACSDIFAQDLEDLPAEIRESVVEDERSHADERPTAAPLQPPQRRQQNSHSNVISEPQRKRFYAIAKHGGWTDDELKHWLLENYGFERSSDITRDKYEEIVAAVQGGSDAN